MSIGMTNALSVIASVICGTGLVLCLACDRSGDPGCVDLRIPGVPTLTPGMDLSIHDRFGRGRAFGTAVSVMVAQQAAASQSGQIYVADTLHEYVYDDPGAYSVHVALPFYRDTTLSNVVVVAGAYCGTVRTTNLDVALQLAPGAPPVRSLTILGTGFLTGPGSQDRLTPYLDADPGVSTAVRWRLSDTTLARIDTTGLVTAKCSTHGGTDSVTAVAVADTTVQGSATFGVGAQATCP